MALLTAHRIRRVGIATCLSILLGGCASLGPRTEGVSGPIVWRITDLRVEAREINGQSFAGRAFTLVLKNIGPQIITITTMDEYRFQHRTNGRVSTSTGRWLLKPGQDWEIPKFYYTVCNFQGGCTDGPASQPMFRIRLTGVNDEDRPVNETINIVLPAEGMGRSPIKR